MAMKPFTYKLLATHTDIRVLQVYPSADNNAEVSATFEIESLAPAASPQFDALSYMWGDQTERATIFIDGAHFSISKHLCSTLRTLRDPTRPRRLWVDAICINQNDTHERNQQVELMKTVYQRANAVLVSLNQHVDASHDAFQKLLTINAASKVNDLGDRPAFWEPLVDLFNDPYWGRVWIQQEISNASVLRLFCQEVELPALALYHFLRLYNEVQLQDIMNPSWRDWVHKKPSVTLPPRFGYIDSHLQSRQGTTIGETSLDLLETLSRANNLKCTDNRDRVYGIMFLAEDCDPGDIAVDYTKTTPEVYTEVARCVVSKYRSTRFLLYATLDYGAMVVSDKTPSWVPDWRRPPARPAMPRPLPPLNDLKTDFQPTSLLPSITNSTLSLHAIKIDTIHITYHHLFTTNILSQAITEFIASCTAITQDAISLTPSPLANSSSSTPSADQLHTTSVEATPQWKSLVYSLGGLNNRDKLKHPNVDVILERGMEEILSLSQQRADDFNPDTYILGLILNRPQSSGTLQLARVFLTFAWWLMAQQRAPFCTEGGRVGLAPACAEVRDEVWLVLGCEAPMLLRGDGNKIWRVVGEVYVDGVNFWEPVGGFQGLGAMREGKEIGGWKVEVVHLR